MHRSKILREISIKAYEVAEGKKEFGELDKLIKSLQEKEETEDVETFVTDNLETLVNETYKTPGLRWRLNSLNRALGSLRKNDFGIIQARPETGKTTLLASEITHMAGQGEGPILWFNNEQDGKAVMLYIYRGALGISLPELYSNIPKHQEDYKNVTKSNLLLYDSAGITKHDVERLAKKYKPKLIVVDQLDKIQGFKADREDLVLGEVYQWAREMAKTYCPFIGITQAGASAEGKKWVGMEDTNNSKTSKAAECDWILGIGCIHDTGWEKIRFLHLSKNKLLGDPDTVPEMRHGKWEALLNAETARYEDIN